MAVNPPRRIAEMPEADFEQAVESDAPPTITKLAGFSSSIVAVRVNAEA